MQLDRHFTNNSKPDDGVALPLVLVLTTMVAITVVALASFATASLRFGNVAMDRSDRLTAADAGMRYAIDQLKLRNAGCILDTQKAILPGVNADFNATSAEVTCERITSGFEGIQAYAAVMTGEGLAANEALLKTQSGSLAKVFGGPVYMTRIDTDAFDLDPDVNIENGPLLYLDDSGTVPCVSKRQSDLPLKVHFLPELIFGPVCVTVPWYELFDNPDVPNLAALPERDGSAVLTDPLGSYTMDTDGCRIFEPGRYTTPPDVDNQDAYFNTGDYLFDFPSANDTFEVNKSVVTAGRINTLTTSVNEVANPKCDNAQLNDTVNPGTSGATFYLGGPSKIRIQVQGSFEVHTRLQGTTDYVSVQALCAPNGTWCNVGGDGGMPTKFSTSTTTLGAPILYTDSGNNKELIMHALWYSPESAFEFGNVTNTAVQKMLGGLIVSKLTLQSSSSATNFEISVPTSPITAEIKLTSTAYKNAKTSAQAIVEYRPYEADIDERIRINSWRVCEFSDCSTSAPAAPCTTDATWNAKYYNMTVGTYNDPPGGVIAFQENTVDMGDDWGYLSPDASVNSQYFSARFTKNVTFAGGAGNYEFTLGTDDGHELFVNGVSVHNMWVIQNISAGTHTFTVPIPDPCNVDLEVLYFEHAGEAETGISWVKI